MGDLQAGAVPGADFSLLESVPDAMVIADGLGTIVWANQLAERLFGWDRDELIGQPIEVLLPARFRAPHQLHRTTYQATPRTRPMGLGLDLFGLRHDGQEFAAEISLAPLPLGEGTFTIAAVRDVTERKTIERRATLYRKAQEEVRERDEFLSVASHELRTPVTALQLQLQLLQRAAARPVGGTGLDGARLAAKIDLLDRQCRRITLLVNELLDVSRLRLGRMQLKLEPVDLLAVAREAVAHLEEAGLRAGCVIEVSGASGGSGRWDRLRLEQVVTNLLSNAIKFGRSRPIAVRVSGGVAGAQLEVSDQGIGISAEDQERIFGRFERAVPIHHFGGLGLGLYIAREIVEAHGGSIALDSAPGVGTTFRVALPWEPPPARPSPAGDPQEAGEGPGALGPPAGEGPEPAGDAPN